MGLSWGCDDSRPHCGRICPQPPSRGLTEFSCWIESPPSLRAALISSLRCSPQRGRCSIGGREWKPKREPEGNPASDSRDLCRIPFLRSKSQVSPALRPGGGGWGVEGWGGEGWRVRGSHQRVDGWQEARASHVKAAHRPYLRLRVFSY